MENRKPVPPGKHTLPPLPYAVNALEPVLGAETVTIHHDIHHKKYVDDLNKTELALVQARKNGDFSHVKCLENDLAFNGSGHILHSVYWTVMASPGTGGSPGEYTQSYINWYFGGMEPFKRQFTQAAITVEGSGWSILGYSPSFCRFELLTAEKHQNLTQWGTIPILVCDVWEHAYYLGYQNKRDEYVDKWWGLVNWPVVEKRLLQAGSGYLDIT